MSALTPEPAAIPRHRTAMVRHDLSQPVALLVRHGLVRPGTRVFDYGCGQGDDLRILGARGVAAAGWDPHFQPDAERTSAEVVNLGFVLNVIERPAERMEALRAAWALTERVLAVSTMIVGQVPVSSLRPLGDGYVTARGTFQKYYQHAELRSLIAATVGVTPVAIAPGIFFAFRRPEDEQEFLLERRAGRRLSTVGYRIPRPPSERARPTLAPVSERIEDVIAEVRDLALRRGRLPHADELSGEALAKLVSERVAFTRALQAANDAGLDPAELAAAAEARREDLLVHYALALLNRSTSAARPSPMMVRDIRAHFGSQKEVSAQAMDYLQALGDETRVREAIAQAEAAGLGIVDHRQRLVVAGARAEALPGVLRCYFGCASFLAGEPDEAFVFRIDPGRRRVVMWPLPQPDVAFPQTELRVQVDLRRQDVDIRPDRRRLVRKADLHGLSARTKQRRLEAAWRAEAEAHDTTIFEKLDAPDRPRLSR